MEFSVNSPILFVMVGVVIAFVLAQSVYFLARAIKRAKELGIAKETISKTMSSSAIFTIAPAIAVLVGVITLSKKPWCCRSLASPFSCRLSFLRVYSGKLRS